MTKAQNIAMTHQHRAQIIQEARSWLGTPYQHQARCKGAGVDCIGLVIGVAQALGLSRFDTHAYGRIPSGQDLHEGLMREALPAGDQWLPGQIALMRFKDEPQHLGILASHADQPTIIHAYGHASQVVEHRLAEVWKSRIVARYEFPCNP